MRWTALLALLLIGCAGQSSVAPPAGPAVAEFESVPGGVRLSFPASWEPVSDDTLLTLTPSDDASGGNRLKIEKPNLPPHIPGLIPLGAVAAGFVADLRQRYNDVEMADPTDVNLAGSAGKRITAVCQGNELTTVTAILCVHGDAVYIIEAETDAAHTAAANEALDVIVRSWNWLE